MRRELADGSGEESGYLFVGRRGEIGLREWAVSGFGLNTSGGFDEGEMLAAVVEMAV